MDQAMQIIEAFITILILVFPVIGITAGFKGLFSQLPSVRAFGLELKPGIYVSWGVGAIMTALANYAGWYVAPDAFATDPTAWLLGQWALLSGLSNYFRQVAYK